MKPPRNPPADSPPNRPNSRRQPASTECAPPARTGPARQRSLRHLLLVDDDEAVRDSLKDVLTAEGYRITPAENGEMALNIAATAKVDLVLLDLNMPVRNGWDTFEVLTREHPLIPIIVVTARSNQLFTAVSAGVGALLEKPMDISVLLRTIKKLLGETTQERLARLAGQETDFHYAAARNQPPPDSRPSPNRE